MSDDTDNESLVCHICEHKSVDKHSLKRHMRVHSNEKPYKCELCDWATKWSGELSRHMARHSGQKRFKCKVCNFRTAFKSNLGAHMRKHTGEKPFACDMCDFRTARRFNLKKHQRKMHTSEVAVQESSELQKDEKSFQCELCDHRSSSEEAIQRHMSVHNSQVWNRCEFNNNDVDQKSNLEEYLNNATTTIKSELDDSKVPCRDRMWRHQRGVEKSIKVKLCDDNVLAEIDLKQLNKRTEKAQKPSYGDNVSQLKTRTENWDHDVLVNIRKKIKVMFYE